MTTFNHTNLYNNLSHEERFFFKNRVESVTCHSPQIQCLTNSRGIYNEPVTHEYVATCVKICVCSEMSLEYVLQTAWCWSSSNALQYSHMVGTQCPLAPSQSRAQLVASLPYQQLSVWATIMWIWEQITKKFSNNQIDLVFPSTIAQLFPALKRPHAAILRDALNSVIGSVKVIHKHSS